MTNLVAARDEVNPCRSTHIEMQHADLRQVVSPMMWDLAHRRTAWTVASFGNEKVCHSVVRYQRFHPEQILASLLRMETAGMEEPSQGLQVIVLAGGTGSRMHPLTDIQHPKALLSITNRPLLFFPMYILERSGFADIIIAANKSNVEDVEQYIHEVYPSDPLIMPIRENLKSRRGTSVAMAPGGAVNGGMTPALATTTDSSASISQTTKTGAAPSLSAGSLSAPSQGVQHADDARSATILQRQEGVRIKVLSVQDDSGTADAIREIASYIYTDFMVVSSDLICDVDLSPFITQHYITDACLTVLVKEKPPAVVVASGGGKSSLAGDENSGFGNAAPVGLDYFGIDESKQYSRLMFMESYADVEESLSIERSILQKCPTLSLRHDLMDAHMYIFQHWVLGLMTKKPSLSSLKNEFIPFLAKNQFLLNELALITMDDADDGRKMETFQRLSLRNLEVLKPKLSKSTLNLSADPTMWNGSVLPELPLSNRIIWAEGINEKGGISSNDRVFCGSYYMPSSVYLRRVNTLDGFMRANQELANKALSWFHPWSIASIPSGTPGSEEAPVATLPSISSSTVLGDKCNVSADSIVGSGTKIGDRSSLKRCVVGDHCNIGNNVKLNSCVVLDHVTIQDGCNLNGCIVCSDADIQSGCVLKECQIGYSATVNEKTEAKGELITKDDGDGDDIFF